MDASTVPLICYFGGVLSSTNSADYIGGRSTASFINKATTVSELCSKAKFTCGISEDSLIKMKCRYPLNQSMAITLDISDDSSLAVAMASIPNLSSSLVIYVEEVSPKQSFMPSGPSYVEGVDKHVNIASPSESRVPSTVEGVDKHLTITSPSEYRVPRSSLKSGRGKDVGWLHCKPVGEGTSKTQCNYCGKIMAGGGITRMKQHLAGGNDVEKCTKCGIEVRQMFRDLIRKKKLSKSRRRMKELQYAEDSELQDCFDQDEDEGKQVSPLVFQSQLSGGRVHEEIALLNKDSDDDERMNLSSTMISQD